jgi:general stress protein 26
MMTLETAKDQALQLVEGSRDVMVGSNGPDGFPYIKAMFNLEHDGLRQFWLGTNTSSKRVRQFTANSNASLYFVDNANFYGLLLLGKMEVLHDRESKQRLWREGYECYYPLGIDDPDYSVLCFNAERGNLYHGLQNITFEI